MENLPVNLLVTISIPKNRKSSMILTEDHEITECNVEEYFHSMYAEENSCG
jgi:hypothetical protein